MLTSSQKKVFDYICSFIKEYEFPPAYSDIAKHFDFSSDGTVRTYLGILEKKGYIKRMGTARGIQILKPLIPLSIPIVGTISAGDLKLAIEEHIGTLVDVQELQYAPDRFALRVSGDSMKDAGILDGDLAIIQKTQAVQNGQIAAIVYEDEATLKRVYFEKDKVRLQPENELYQPILIPRREFDKTLVGKYIALVRKAR
ncbi:MAG: repressor LexA [Candidatus Margulisbacteria bacterium]|nr:repressor LexA [Candidatus Margulisiibacteriota bacterium]